MHDEINALLAQAALKHAIEFELARQRFPGAALCFNMEINVTTVRIVPHPRAKQQRTRVLAEVPLHFLTDDRSLYIGESDCAYCAESNQCNDAILSRFHGVVIIPRHQVFLV